MYVGRILPNDSLRVSSRERSKGCVLNKASEENGDANRFRGARGASLVSAGLCGQLLNRDLGYARMGPRAAPSPRERMTMEESLVNVEFLKSSNNFIARIQSELGGMREYRSSSFEEVLEQVVIDLQEEFESY